MLYRVESDRAQRVMNETSAVTTEVCRLALEVPVLESEQDVSADLCKARGTCRCNRNQEGRHPSALEKRCERAA